MLKTVVLWLFLQPLAPIATSMDESGDCPPVLSFHKTGKSSDSFSVSWDYDDGTVQYILWYKREADGYLSQPDFISNTNYTFYGLSPGRYTFYIAAVCGEVTSDYIGVDDLIET